VDSGLPGKPPNEVEVKVGLSDGSSTEITEGLAEGDTVLIPRVNLGGARSGGSLFMPSRGGRR